MSYFVTGATGFIGRHLVGELNVGGDASRLRAGRGVAGRLLPPGQLGRRGREYDGTFDEPMFDEGQSLPSPYHRTKFESERIVREQAADVVIRAMGSTCPTRSTPCSATPARSPTPCVAPKLAFRVLNLAYHVFPDSAAAKGAHW